MKKKQTSGLIWSTYFGNPSRKKVFLEHAIIMGTNEKEVEHGVESDWKLQRGIKVKAKAEKTRMPFYYRVKVKRVL